MRIHWGFFCPQHHKANLILSEKQICAQCGSFISKTKGPQFFLSHLQHLFLGVEQTSFLGKKKDRHLNHPGKGRLSVNEKWQHAKQVDVQIHSNTCKTAVRINCLFVVVIGWMYRNGRLKIYGDCCAVRLRVQNIFFYLFLLICDSRNWEAKREMWNSSYRVQP